MADDRKVSDDEYLRAGRLAEAEGRVLTAADYDIADARARLEAVKALHRDVMAAVPDQEYKTPWCAPCARPWPCPTFLAVSDLPKDG